MWKMMKRGTLLIVGIMLISSCGFNLYSVFNPTDTSTVTSAETLVAMGEEYLTDGKYDSALVAFEKAIQLDPRNSRAREGACTAKMFSIFNYSDLMKIAGEGGLTNLNFNDIYLVSSYMGNTLWPIINGSCDGKIPANDVAINFDFLLFNSLYSIFYIADTDGDINIQGDNDDLFTLTNGMEIVSNIDRFSTLDTNTLSELLGLVNIINNKQAFFHTMLSRSKVSLMNITNQMRSSNTIDFITNNLTSQIDSLTFQMDSQLSNLTALDITNTLQIPDLGAISNFIPATYEDFTNLLAEANITNIYDVTNLVPDLTNVIDWLTNYYDVPNL